VVRRGITAEDKPEQAAIFATGLNRPSASIFILRGRIRNGSVSGTVV